MIEPTDEMREAVRAVLDRPFTSDGDVVKAVLAIVERNVVPEAYGMGRDDEANDDSMAVTLDEINARRGRPW